MKLSVDEAIQFCEEKSKNIKLKAGPRVFVEIAEMLEQLKIFKDLEEQGLLLRLPCAIGDTVWGWEYPTRIDEEDGSTWTICDIKRAKVIPKKFHLIMLDRTGESCFLTKEEAEQALAKMKEV